jgi:antitoxin Phd
MLTAVLNRWSLQDAKNQFSELVRRVMSEGPQMVTRSGQDAVVVIAASEYEQLMATPRSLVDFLQASPLADVQIDVNRPRESGRSVEL